METTKSLFDKYRDEYISNHPKGEQINEDHMLEYIEMRLQEWSDRWRYEDGDHYEPREPHLPEYDYPN